MNREHYKITVIIPLGGVQLLLVPYVSDDSTIFFSSLNSMNKLRFVWLRSIFVCSATRLCPFNVTLSQRMLPKLEMCCYFLAKIFSSSRMLACFYFLSHARLLSSFCIVSCCGCACSAVNFGIEAKGFTLHAHSTYAKYMSFNWMDVEYTRTRVRVRVSCASM